MEINHRISPQNVNSPFAKGEPYARILNAVPAMIAYVDHNLLYEYVNVAFENFFSKTRTELYQKSLTEIFNGKEPESLKNIETHGANDQLQFEVNTFLNDSEKALEIILTPDFDKYENIKGYTVLVNDVTAKKGSPKNSQKSSVNETAYFKHYYSELIEKLPVAVYTCDADGNIEMYNRAAADLWGREPKIGEDKWCGSWRIYDLKGSPVALDTCPMAIALKEGRSVYGEEIVVERPDGSRLHIEPYPRPILDESGNIIGAVNMLMDVTERKKAEEANAKLAAIVQSSDDAIISKTLNGIIVSWNNAAERMFGYTASEMIGKSITKIIPTERLDEEPKILDRIKRGERVDHFETVRQAKDGRLLNISLTISPVRDNKGKIIGASKIARDITEQKKLFEALRESEERFRTVADTAPVMVWMAGPDKLWNYLNKGWLKFTGRNLEQEQGFGWTKNIHPDDLDLTFRTYNNCFNKRKSFELEFRVKQFDGVYHWVLCCGVPRHSSDNSFLGFIGTCTDIHERKASREELERLVAERTAALQLANMRLEKSNNELERFAYVASHDLQEPLRKIQAFGDLLMERSGNEFSSSAKDYLARMIKSAHRMQSLIESLLEFSRTNTLQKNFEERDLKKLVEEVKKDFQETIDEKKATINISPLAIAPVIPFQFKQMVSNILSNALKYTKATEAPVITITSEIISGKEIQRDGVKTNTDYLRLIIQDNGIGFENENAEKIFQLFQRLHGRHEYSGSGIGLSICKKIAENHNGFIMAEGEKNKGAIFNIYLPMQQN